MPSKRVGTACVQDISVPDSDRAGPPRTGPHGLLNAVLASLQAVEDLKIFDHRVRILRTVRGALGACREGTLAESEAIRVIEEAVRLGRARQAEGAGPGRLA